MGELLSVSDAHVFITHANTLVAKQAREELKDSCCVIDSGKTIAMNPEDEALYQSIHEEAEHIWESEAKRIALWMMKFISKEDLSTLLPVPSSGVYCNLRVNMKKLFMQPDRLLLILYLMTKKVYGFMDRVDTLICPSRNGANLAALIGRLLHMKVCYCETVGPKFSLALPNVKKGIHEGEKYLAVYDFICLGTEIKLLNAIVGVMGAELVAGVGIANYAVLDGKDGIMGKMVSLVNLQEDGICRIAGTLGEIETMLWDGRKPDEPGIFRVQVH